jgi:hypothetical protein
MSERDYQAKEEECLRRLSEPEVTMNFTPPRSA